MLQPLEISDFSGGITDQFVGTNPSMSQRLKNFQITVDKKPSVRPGSTLEGQTDLFCKIPGPVNHLIPAFTLSELPYKLSTWNLAGRLYASDGTTHNEIVGPTGNPIFTQEHFDNSDQRFISDTYNSHTFITSGSFTQKPHKIFTDALGILQLRTAGLPTPVDNHAWSIAGTTPAHNYVYALGWKYTYLAGNRTFVDRGPLLRKFTPFQAPTNTLTGLPTLSNGATDNYDTAVLELEIYRTTDNGRVFFLVASVVNGTASYTDTTTDLALQDKETHYTTGGIPENDPPPISKFIHITERGIGLYGHVLDGTDESKNMFKQSIPYAPDKVPGIFNAELDEELTGISSYHGIPLLFSREHVYRGEGLFSETGQGGMVPRKIADSVGCISHNSIIQTPDGVFFAGVAGFYWTDGYSVRKISDGFNQTYQNAYGGNVADISCAFDEVERQVYWNFPETSYSDGLFVYHLRFQIRDASTFTTWGGMTDPSVSLPNVYPPAFPDTVTRNFRAKCLLNFNGRIYRGDDRGYAFYFVKNKKTDPRVDPSSDCGLWDTAAIMFDYRTVALNFGTDFIRKWTPKVITTLKNRGNIALTIQSDRDLESRPKPCREIKKISSFQWGNAGVLWGDPVIYTTELATFEEIRMLPVPGIRCSYRQLYYQNSFTVYQKSDNLGLATLDAVGNTLTLNNVLSVYPTDILDLYVSFPDPQGAYTNSYLIDSRTASVIHFQDPLNILTVSGVTPWEIRGYPKGFVLEIQSVVVTYMMLASTQGVYRPGTEDANA